LRKLIISLQTVWLLSSVFEREESWEEKGISSKEVDKRNGKRMQKGKK